MKEVNNRGNGVKLCPIFCKYNFSIQSNAIPNDKVLNSMIYIYIISNRENQKVLTFFLSLQN